MTNIAVGTDAYKVSHKGFLEKCTEIIYSNFTPRSDTYMPVLRRIWEPKIVLFGMQGFIQEFLIEKFNKEFFNVDKDKAVKRLKRRFDTFFGKGKVDTHHFEQFHDLGFLPVVIKALPEGSRVNIKVPFFTIRNTDKRFAWLTNYLETLLSTELWKPSTIATIAYEYRKLCDQYAMETVGHTGGVEFQCHDFSMRGMSGIEDAKKGGAGHLLSFKGTDTLPAIDYIEDFYGADAEKEFIGTSVPASEHSIASLGYAVRGELESFRKWITEDYPVGIVSLVSDTTDYWKVITEYAKSLKEEILARTADENGMCKVVFRPDSGNPADIICGVKFEDFSHIENLKDAFQRVLININTYKKGMTFFKHGTSFYEVYENGPCYDYKIVEDERIVKGSIELLWETFGGTITDKGYKLLDSHVGLIYGDSITLEVADDIMARLKAKGFASTNVVLGIGSYTYNYLTRDSAGMAMKATYASVGGEDVVLEKNPVTDSGTKKSAKGLLRVEKEGNDFKLFDNQTWDQESEGELDIVFCDGELVKFETFSMISDRLLKG